MSEYKLVPVEPTPEMVDAARDQHEGEAYLPVSLYKAMLAAAPDVQGEPTDNELLEWAEDEQFFLFCDEDEFLQIARSVIHKYGRKGTVDVLAAPQPAEQQPDATQLVEALESLMKGYASLLEGGIDRITHLDGDCYLISDMLKGAREALANYRKQGGEV